MRSFSSLFFLAVAFDLLMAEDNFALECSIASEEYHDKWSFVGKITVENLHTSKKKEVSLKLGSNAGHILPCFQLCQNGCTYLLRMRNMENEKNQVFLSSLSSNFIGNEKFNEKIEIYLNFQEDIIGFSYLMSKPLEKYQFPEPPSAFLSEAFEAPQMHIHQEEEVIKEKGGAAAAAEDPENQSFFKKYFWYIVIGGVLFFMLQSVDKEKLNETLKKAQEEAQKRQQ